MERAVVAAAGGAGADHHVPAERRPVGVGDAPSEGLVHLRELERDLLDLAVDRELDRARPARSVESDRSNLVDPRLQTAHVESSPRIGGDRGGRRGPWRPGLEDLVEGRGAEASPARVRRVGRHPGDGDLRGHRHAIPIDSSSEGRIEGGASRRSRSRSEHAPVSRLFRVSARSPACQDEREDHPEGGCGHEAPSLRTHAVSLAPTNSRAPPAGSFGSKGSLAPLRRRRLVCAPSAIPGERSAGRRGVGEWTRLRWMRVLPRHAAVVGLALVAACGGGGGGRGSPPAAAPGSVAMLEGTTLREDVLAIHPSVARPAAVSIVAPPGTASPASSRISASGTTPTRATTAPTLSTTASSRRAAAPSSGR